MAKLRRRYRILLSHETAYFRTCICSWTKILPLGYRSWIAYFLQSGLSDRIEIIDDRSQSAVVDSLLELVSRRRKRVVSCSFLITAGRKRSTLFSVWQQRGTIKTSNQIQTTIAKRSRSRLRRTSSVQSGSTGCVCMVRSLTATEQQQGSFKGRRPGPLTRHSIRPDPTD
jgi:hypothetical protein